MSGVADRSTRRQLRLSRLFGPPILTRLHLLFTMAIATPSLPPLPRTLILDYYDSCEYAQQGRRWMRENFPLMKDTNNLLTLFTKLYSDSEVLKKVVVVKADRYSW